MANTMEMATKMAEDLRVRTNREVEIKEVEKNNGVMKTGLVVKSGDVCPTIYVEDFLSKGDPYEVMIDKIVDILKESVEMQEVDLGDFDINRFSKFDYIAPKITMQLVNKERNLNLLGKVPSVDFLDFAMIFRVYVSKGASVVITNDHMNTWGVTTEMLEKLARENTPRLMPAESMSIEDFIPIPFPDEMLMWILTNTDKSFGASVILYEDVCREVADKFDDDLVLIPSSVHEWIALPYSKYEVMQDLVSIIREVNTTQVAPEEVLGDKPYVYLRETDTFELM